MGWAGRASVRGSSVVIKDARPLHAGLCKAGTPDLIGWTCVKITQEMVGENVAVFTAIEVKTGGTKTTKLQRAFINTVKKMGGISGIVRGFSGILKRRDNESD